MEQAPLLFTIAVIGFSVWAVMTIFGPWWAGLIFVGVAIYEWRYRRKHGYWRGDL